MGENPFRFGQVATGWHFTDRARELAEVQEDIKNGQNVVIISPRRYGKTSLIAEARRRLEREVIDQDARTGYRIGEVFFRAWIDRRIRPDAAL